MLPTDPWRTGCPGTSETRCSAWLMSADGTCGCAVISDLGPECVAKRTCLDSSEFVDPALLSSILWKGRLLGRSKPFIGLRT